MTEIYVQAMKLTGWLCAAFYSQPDLLHRDVLIIKWEDRRLCILTLFTERRQAIKATNRQTIKSYIINISTSCSDGSSKRSNLSSSSSSCCFIDINILWFLSKSALFYPLTETLRWSYRGNICKIYCASVSSWHCFKAFMPCILNSARQKQWPEADTEMLRNDQPHRMQNSNSCGAP